MAALQAIYEGPKAFEDKGIGCQKDAQVISKSTRSIQKRDQKAAEKQSLKKGLGQGDAALISAILEGEGELRVVQTVVIPQKLLQIEQAKLHDPKVWPTRIRI